MVRKLPLYVLGAAAGLAWATVSQAATFASAELSYDNALLSSFNLVNLNNYSSTALTQGRVVVGGNASFSGTGASVCGSTACGNTTSITSNTSPTSTSTTGTGYGALTVFGSLAGATTSSTAINGTTNVQGSVTTGGTFALGMLGPAFFVKQMRGALLKKVARGLPDALDMMVICAQAGLGLENAIERVAQEFQFANQAVALELAICASEMRIGTDRRTALLSLGDRTGLEAMRRLAGTLIQTMQLGTPRSQALRVLAAEMRTDNLTKFEEKAARLPVFLTLPMIVFILPCVFIVVGGPAGLSIVKTLGGH